MTIRHTRHTGFRLRPKERGAAIVLITIAMLVLILMAGLALDVGHMMVNKTRLQNAVDAAALSAAKTLDETSSTSLATAAALQALGLDANDPGNQELGTSYNGGSLNVTVEYSSTLPPFVAGSATGPATTATAGATTSRRRGRGSTPADSPPATPAGAPARRPAPRSRW